MAARVMDPEYWRSRAEEAREDAAQMYDPRTRQTLRQIADNYEQIAQQVDRRKKLLQSGH